jgi:predicted metalloenzyme YecM
LIRIGTIINTLQNIIGDYEEFLGRILKEITDEGFDLSDFAQMDHMCYRVASMEQYAAKKGALSEMGTMIGEATVNGRPIAVFRLQEPVIYGKWRIDAIELPAPKSGEDTREGLEHVEFVLFDDQVTFLKKYSGKAFNLRAADRGVNPEIGFKLPSYSVKFHLLSLPTAVYLQNKLGMTEVKDGQ